MYDLDKSQIELLKKLKKRDPRLHLSIDLKYKIISHLHGNIAGPFKLKKLKKSPFATIKPFLKTNIKLFGDVDIDEDLREEKIVFDKSGKYHVVFFQKYQGVNIRAASLRIHFSKDSRITTVTSTLIPRSYLDLPVKAEISDNEAMNTVLKHAGENAEPIKDRPPELKIFFNKKENKHVLVWVIELDGRKQKKPAHWYYFIDAITGKRIHRYNNMRSGSPTNGQGIPYYDPYNGGINDEDNPIIVSLNTYKPDNGDYQLRDVTRVLSWPYDDWPGPEVVTNDCKDEQPSEDINNNWKDYPPEAQDNTDRRYNQRAEVDAHLYAGETTDYFHFIHERNSYDDKGAKITIDVHYLTSDDNPCEGHWDPQDLKVELGDGDGVNHHNYLVSDDWVAHELTHAFTITACELSYEDEAGALNEAYSDSFAAFITGDWLVFEDTFIRGGIYPERNMIDPTNGDPWRFPILESDPNHYNPHRAVDSAWLGHTPDHYELYYGGDETDAYNNDNMAHVNCGIINHAIYLMTVGGTHRNGIDVEGIGQVAMEKLLYSLIVNEWHGLDEKFLDFRVKILTLCDNEFPGDLDKLLNIKTALNAVGIGPDLYIRDTLHDDGREPNPDGISWRSPDIIVRNNRVQNPQAVFNDRSIEYPSDNIEYGQDNYVYVRISNRGYHPTNQSSISADVNASYADVDIYLCPTTTFAHPSSWQLLGTIQETNIRPGEVRVSDPPLTIPSNIIPEPGHYCLVAVITNNMLDPAPDHNLIDSIDDFHRYIQYCNNYAWKNTNIVDDITPGEPRSLTFLIGAMPNYHFRTDLEIDTSALPPKTEVQIKIPAESVSGVNFTPISLGRKIKVINNNKIQINEGLRHKNQHRCISYEKGLKIFKIYQPNSGKLEKILMKPKGNIKANIIITLPKEEKQYEDDFPTLRITQKKGNIKLGQITYIIKPK